MCAHLIHFRSRLKNCNFIEWPAQRPNLILPIPSESGMICQEEWDKLVQVWEASNVLPKNIQSFNCWQKKQRGMNLSEATLCGLDVCGVCACKQTKVTDTSLTSQLRQPVVLVLPWATQHLSAIFSALWLKKNNLNFLNRGSCF